MVLATTNLMTEKTSPWQAVPEFVLKIVMPRKWASILPVKTKPLDSRFGANDKLRR